jgi:hypothetical protein
MAVVKWNGGASLVAQVDTLTVGGTVENDDVFTITLTGENGATSSISVGSGDHGGNTSSVASALQAECAASTDPLFAAITWTQPTQPTVRATAKIPGVPFYLTVATTEAGGGAADAQTFARAATTANSGPNDWNTASNWSGSSVPVSTDDVLLNGSRFSVLYGLDQSSVALSSLRVGPTMQGTIGNPVDGYNLEIDATDLIIESPFCRVWFDGSTTRTTVTATPQGSDSVVLGGSHTTLTLTGQAVRGEVRTLASTSHSTTNVLNIGPGGRLSVGSNSGSGTVRLDGGVVDWAGGNISTVDIIRGIFKQTQDGTVTTARVYSRGVYDCRSSGTIAALSTFGGRADFTQSEVSGVTITNATLVAGELDLRSGLDNVTLTNNPTTTAGQVFIDRGQTVDPKV